MQIDVQVEEPSAEEALRHILPRILRDRATFCISNYGSKHNLLKKLPSRLKGYAQQISRGEQLKLAVLVDRDDDDCHELKRRLEDMARAAGLATKSVPDANGDFVVLNRLAIEELEAWFIGDDDAVRAAFPRVPPFRNKAKFRDPDTVQGTWEAFHQRLKRSGVYPDHYPKIEAASLIAVHMDVARSRSTSFRVFCSGMEALLP